RLHRSKDVTALLGLLTADPQLSEVSVLQRRAEGLTRLLQNRVAVSDEQQRIHGPRSLEPRVIQSRDDGLAGPGRGNDEVSNQPLAPCEGEVLEDAPLIVVRVHVQEAHELHLSTTRRGLRSLQRSMEPFDLTLGAVEGNEAGVRILPVATEDRLELL